MLRLCPSAARPRRLPTLFLWALAALFATAAHAQVVRPSESVYVLLRGAVAGYYGDLDDSQASSSFEQLGDGFKNPGFGVGGEVGYLFDENLSLGLAFWYQDIPALNDGVPFAGVVNTQGGEAYQLQALFRYLPFAEARLSPFVELGAALVAGQGTENERNNGTADEDVFGYGPVLGVGLDFAVTPQFSLFLAAQSTVVFPDVALDGADGGALNRPFSSSDDADFDVLANLGGGLRFALRAPVTAVMIEGLECPAELETGEAGTFAVYTNADATAPVSASWQWGDGSTGSGLTDRHAFNSAGTYTVTAMTTNGGGTDSESCLVSVVAPAVMPALAGCRATPSTADVGESVSVSATATDADDITVDFGDGTTASTLPARHSYGAAGRYTVRITATNESGSDTCTIPVTVQEPVDAFCADITELNPVFFGYGSTTLSADARARLDENIEVLRRCPDICVTINGYSDGSEPGDAQRISEARAEAVRAYYVGQGLDASRFTAAGRGVAPGANSKEDPGPGDARARRADSIPSACR